MIYTAWKYLKHNKDNAIKALSLMYIGVRNRLNKRNANLVMCHVLRRVRLELI